MNVFQERGITHLDLHGERHFDVNLLVLDFVLQYQNEIPLIVCTPPYGGGFLDITRDHGSFEGRR